MPCQVAAEAVVGLLLVRLFYSSSVAKPFDLFEVVGAGAQPRVHRVRLPTLTQSAVRASVTSCLAVGYSKFLSARTEVVAAAEEVCQTLHSLLQGAEPISRWAPVVAVVLQKVFEVLEAVWLLLVVVVVQRRYLLR